MWCRIFLQLTTQANHSINCLTCQIFPKIYTCMVFVRDLLCTDQIYDSLVSHKQIRKAFSGWIYSAFHDTYIIVVYKSSRYYHLSLLYTYMYGEVLINLDYFDVTKLCLDISKYRNYIIMTNAYSAVNYCIHL